MGQLEQNELSTTSSISYLEEEITLLREMLSYALGVNQSEIKFSFPTLKNFYFTNNIYKLAYFINLLQRLRSLSFWQKLLKKELRRSPRIS